ncbi:MAG: hypothetical protein KF729_14490 [Sandaracinaceae bacterium]|nr:hypothetical protein [Sandaracinaceae bacterium]
MSRLTSLTAFALAASVLATPRPAAACTEAPQTFALVFDLFQGRVDPVSYPVIDALAARLAGCPHRAIELQVHTETVRTGAFNLRQSHAVAEDVRALLAARGVDPSRLLACGYGEERPLGGTPSWAPDAPGNRLVVRAVPSARPSACRPREP